MVDAWITAGNFDPRDIANPLFAAYDNEVYPGQVHILTPSNTIEPVETAVPVIEALSEEADQAMEISIHRTPANTTEFREHTSELFSDIDVSTVALDITGRPSIYSTLLFQQAVKDNLDADHVYHLDYLLPPDTLKEDFYHLIPKTALNLTDILADFTSEEPQ